MAPEQVAALTAAGAAGGYQMLYRFAAADTSAQIDADRAVRGGERPGGSADRNAILAHHQNQQRGQHRAVRPVPDRVRGARACSWRSSSSATSSPARSAPEPAGSASSRRSGSRPTRWCGPTRSRRWSRAAVGAALGVVAGNLLIIPILAQTNEVYGTADSGVTPWVNVAVLAGALALVAATGVGRGVPGRTAAHRRRARRRAHPRRRPGPVGGPVGRATPASPTGHPRPGPSVRPRRQVSHDRRGDRVRRRRRDLRRRTRRVVEPGPGDGEPWRRDRPPGLPASGATAGGRRTSASSRDHRRRRIRWRSSRRSPLRPVPADTAASPRPR